MCFCFFCFAVTTARKRAEADIYYWSQPEAPPPGYLCLPCRWWSSTWTGAGRVTFTTPRGGWTGWASSPPPLWRSSAGGAEQRVSLLVSVFTSNSYLSFSRCLSLQFLTYFTTFWIVLRHFSYMCVLCVCIYIYTYVCIYLCMYTYTDFTKIFYRLQIFFLLKYLTFFLKIYEVWNYMLLKIYYKRCPINMS